MIPYTPSVVQRKEYMAAILNATDGIYHERNSYPPRPSASGDMSFSHGLRPGGIWVSLMVYMPYPTPPRGISNIISQFLTEAQWYVFLSDSVCGVRQQIDWQTLWTVNMRQMLLLLPAFNKRECIIHLHTEWIMWCWTGYGVFILSLHEVS